MRKLDVQTVYPHPEREDLRGGSNASQAKNPGGGQELTHADGSEHN